MFAPETPGKEMDLFLQFMNISLPRGGNPIDLRAKPSAITNKMAAHIKNEDVIEYVKGQLASMRFLSALPPEYGLQVERLRTENTPGG